MVTAACRMAADIDLKNDMIGKSKMVQLSMEDCRLKPYVQMNNLSSVRLIFQERTRMIKCAGNYKNIPKYRGPGALCRCGELDSQAHLMTCELFTHLRVGGVDLKDNADLVTYLREVIHLREEWSEKKIE